MCNDHRNAQVFHLFLYLILPYMFRTFFYPIFRGRCTNSAVVHRTPLIWRLQGSPVDFFLFPRLKSFRIGVRFTVVAAIQQRVTAVLRSIPIEAFGERCQQCVMKDGDYFEGQ
jgi:hypothetical protein